MHIIIVDNGIAINVDRKKKIDDIPPDINFRISYEREKERDISESRWGRKDIDSMRLVSSCINYNNI